MRFFFLLSIITPHFLFAQEVAESIVLEDPQWFPLLEVGGMIVTIFALISVRRVLKALGGHMGNQFTYIQMALGLILFAFAFRATIEFMGLEGLMYEVVFELPFYGAALLMAYSAKKLAAVLGGGK